MENRKQSLITGICISVFFAFTVLFYGPLSQYLSNAEELWFGLSDVLLIILPTSLIAIALVAVFSYILPPEISGFVLELFFGVSLALYVQGNYLKSNYGSGLMDGSEIDWSRYTAYGIFDTLLWVALIAAPFIAAWFLRDKKSMIAKVLIIASLFFTAVQIPALIVQAASFHPNENARVSITKKDMFDLSPEKNVVVILLDEMDERYYQEYLKKNPEYTKQLEGFVHYGNTLSSGARTTIAVPSMMTGIPYHRQSLYSEYIRDVYNRPNVLSVLDDDGYTVSVYSETTLFPVEASEFVTNFSDNGQEVGSYKILMKKLYKLDLFKFLPHFMKKYVWFDTQEFDSAKVMYESFRPNDAKFYRDFKKNGFTVNDQKDKVFQFYHLYAAHEPYMLDNRLKRVKEGTSLEEQVSGVFRCVSDMLSDLKEKGLYDQATIIITADHGSVNKDEYPMFMVKRPGDMQEYSESDVPVSLFDFAVFMTGLVGKELPDQKYGMKLDELTEDMTRERHFFLTMQGFSKGYGVEEYKTTGRADDPDRLVFVKSYEDVEDENTPYSLGTELSFKADATGNKYCVEGLGDNTGFRTRLYGPEARFHIPISDMPAGCDLKCSIIINSTQGEHNTVIKANGTEIFNDKIDRKLIREGLVLDIPHELMKNTNILELEFIFPDVPEEEMEEENIMKRTETLSLKKMIIDKAENFE